MESQGAVSYEGGRAGRWFVAMKGVEGVSSSCVKTGREKGEAAVEEGKMDECRDGIITMSTDIVQASHGGSLG